MALRSKPKKLDATALWEYALRALGQRGYSAFELKRKLAGRAETPAAVNEVLAKLREYGFTDDKKFSETFAVSRLQNQGFGRLRVINELRSRHVADSIAGEAVEKAFANTDEQELIDQYLQRKYRAQNLTEFLQDEKNLASAYRRLRTAGFSTQASLSALKRHANQTRDWDLPEEEDPV